MSGMQQSPIELDDTMPAWIHAPIEYRNYFAKDDTRFAETIHHNKVIIYKTLKVTVSHNIIVLLFKILEMEFLNYVLFFRITMESWRTTEIRVSNSFFAKGMHKRLFDHFCIRFICFRFYRAHFDHFNVSVVWHLQDDTTMRLKKCWPKCPSIRNGPFGGSTHTHAYYLLQIQFHFGDLGSADGSEHSIGNQT